jgi:uncharacterized LabA/DUF88 family protein
LSETRLKIALFIDFDNIEIGVKTTLGGHFDVGAVLEAMKERGEVVTKVAYGDWTRAGDYSRSLTQHAIQMVQRNLTPGGDKNGADINLALDALEMAFTHSHINAFVIVGGDSDFMALVEKLKLYDRQVFVVGGRAFTSVILQKNCTEFIAYENLIGRRGSSSRGGASKDVKDAMPLVKRALKVLADREVTPQLGVLKSTLLQLDSTFSEREYGVSTFRDFVQKLERAQLVTLRGDERSLLVEPREGLDALGSESSSAPAAPPAPAAAPAPVAAPAAPRQAAAQPEAAAERGNEAAGGQLAEGYALIRDIFLRPGVVSRWPLYVRQAKQVIRAANEQFDERRYGFNGIVDALRHSQREGLFRLDRDRQGVIRIYPGPLLEGSGGATTIDRDDDESDVDGETTADPVLPEMFEAGANGDGDDAIATSGSAGADGEAPSEAAAGTRGRRRGRGGRGRGRGRDTGAEPAREVEPLPIVEAEVVELDTRPQDGELFAELPVDETAQAAADVDAVADAGAEKAPAGSRKATRKRAPAAPRKKAAPVKKTARKTSR